MRSITGILRGTAGFTLMEMVVSIVILSTVVLIVSNLFVSDVSLVSLSKAQTIGLALANQQMEYLRDLPYNSLATQLGTIYPPGTIPDNQNITSGNYTFRIHTVIKYVDDPYDGNATGTIVGKPTDLYPYDYKLAEITVYLSSTNHQVAVLTSNFAAKAAETASNTGILAVKVIDANGQPVTGANIVITDTNVTPNVNIATTTDDQGNVLIPALPPDSNHGYKITASLPGYSTNGTLADPPGAQTAVNPNVNVLVQQITNVTLSIDRTSTLNLHVVDTSGNPLSGVAITTTGAKLIYTNPSVFKYNTASTTDANGNISLSGMEWDSYSFKPPGSYHLVTASPYAPTALNPNTTQTVTLVLSNSGSYPTITSVSPDSGTTGTSGVAVTITGTNFSGPTTVKLNQVGQPSVTATGVTTTATSIGATFDLTTAPVGAWDLVVTTNGHTLSQTGGFNVTN